MLYANHLTCQNDKSTKNCFLYLLFYAFRLRLGVNWASYTIPHDCG